MSASDLDRSLFEAAFARKRSLGLRPGFRFARLPARAKANKDASLVERRKVALSGIDTFVSFERPAPVAA